MKLTRSLYIKQVVGVSFGLVLFLAVLIGLAGRFAYEISQRQNEVVQTRGRVNGLTLNLQILTLERIESLRRFLELGDVRLRLLYQSQRSAYVTTYTELASLLRNQAEAVALQDVLAAEDAFNDLVEETFALYDNGSVDEAQRLWRDEGIALQRSVFAATEAWNQVQADNSEVIIQQARRIENIAVTSVAVFVGLILLAGTVASVIITKSITKPISRLVDGTKSIDFDLTTRVEPDGPQDIAFLGKSINHMAHRLLESKQALQRHKDQLEQELIAASQAQLSFLPRTNPQISGLNVACYWQPARELAGDFFTHVNLSSEMHGFVLADVVGKGAAAAMAGALTLGLVESHIFAYAKPETFLQRLNRELCLRFNSNHLKVACIYAIFDEASNQISIANAGCIFPYLRRGDELGEVDVPGLPLGLSADFEYRAQTIALEPGDLLLLCSDGLVEAHNQSGALFGFDRLEKALQQVPVEATAQTVEAYLIDALETFTGDTGLSDDVTLIVIRVTDRIEPAA